MAQPSGLVTIHTIDDFQVRKFHDAGNTCYLIVRENRVMAFNGPNPYAMSATISCVKGN